MLTESGTYLSIARYTRHFPVLIYFTRTHAYFLDVRDMPDAEFFESKRVPSEIESVVSVGSRLCARTTDNHIVYYELTLCLEFKEISRIYLGDCWSAQRLPLRVFKGSAAIVESKCVRVIASEPKETVVASKSSIIDIEFADDFMATLESGKSSVVFNVYEACVDVTVHRTMLVVDDTSYLLTRVKGGFCVFFDTGFTMIRNGKVHKVVPIGSRVVCHFFDQSTDDLYVHTSDGGMLVISSVGSVEHLTDVGQASSVFVFDNHLLTLGTTNRMYRIPDTHPKCLAFICEVARHPSTDLDSGSKNTGVVCEVRKDQSSYFEDTRDERFRVYKTWGDNMSLSVRKARLINRADSHTLSSASHAQDRSYRQRIFVSGREVVLLKDTTITHYTTLGSRIELVRCEDVQKNMRHVLFSDTGHVQVCDNEQFSGSISRSGDLYFTYSASTVYSHSIESGRLTFVDRKVFDFSIDSLCAFGTFLVLQSGRTLRIFNYKLGIFVFVQQVQHNIQGLFVADSFLYVLTAGCIVSIYKLDWRTGYAELPIRVSLGGNIWRMCNGVAYSKTHLYVFVKYDFVAMEAPKNIVDALFCGNRMYVCSRETFDVFSMVFEPDCNKIFTTAPGKSQKRNYEKSLKYDVYSNTYIHNAHLEDSAETNTCLETGADELCSTSAYKLVVSHTTAGSVVEVFEGHVLVNRREFDAEVRFATSVGKVIVCAFKFCCMVFFVGKKQLVAKSRVKLRSAIIDLRACDQSIFIVTQIHSIFKYELVGSTLRLVCSDTVARRISYFRAIASSLVVFSDTSGFVGVLREDAGRYEVDMCVCTDGEVVECVALPTSVVYRTADGRVGEVFCVGDRVFSILDSIRRNTSHVERRTLYPIVNVFPRIEAMGLLADNLKTLGKSVQSSDLCCVLRILHGG